MTAGDIGVVVNLDFAGADLSGGSGSLYAVPVSPTGEPRGTAIDCGPVTIAEDGLTGTYSTTGGDFLQGGNWQAQVEVVTAIGSFTSQLTAPVGPFSLYVFPRIGPWPVRFGSPTVAQAPQTLVAVGTATPP